MGKSDNLTDSVPDTHPLMNRGWTLECRGGAVVENWEQMHQINIKE
jgi:hypothetical protein